MVERSRTAKFHFSPPDSFQLSSLISSRRAYAYFMAPRRGAPRTSPGSLPRARPRSHTAGPAVLGPARCPHVPAAQSCPHRGRGAAGGFEGRFGLQEINQHQRGAQPGTHTHTHTQTSSLRSLLKAQAMQRKSSRSGRLPLVGCSFDRGSQAFTALSNAEVKKPAAQLDNW